jgi:hypothetical protein
MSGSTLPDLLLTRDEKNWQQTTLPVQDVPSQDIPLSRQEPAVLFKMQWFRI